MRHEDSHLPTRDHDRCLVCNQALSAAFAKLYDMHLGPQGTSALMDALNGLAREAIAHGAAS
jgi:hypothetical protein